MAQQANTLPFSIRVITSCVNVAVITRQSKYFSLLNARNYGSHIKIWMM